MKIGPIHINRRANIILLVALVLLVLMVRQQIRQMDERFFQPSLSGIKGLALYMVGDYNGAAKAYRAHFQETYQTERTADDPAWDALLRGDLQETETISRKQLEEETTSEKEPALEGEPVSEEESASEKKLASIGARLNLGEIALYQGTFDQALQWFDEVLKKERDQFDALLLSSVAHAKLGHYGEAIDLLNRALRTYRIEWRITSFLWAFETTGGLADLPRSQRTNCLLAHYYRYLRIFDDSNGRLAIRAAKKAIVVGDRPDDAYLTIGIVYDKQEKREQALQAFLKAIEINPKNAEALRWASFSYGYRGDLANEYRMSKAAFEAKPNDRYNLDRLHYVLQEKLGDYPQAIQILEEGFGQDPANGETLGWLGYLYAHLGNYERSIDYYQKAIELEPKKPEHQEGVGFALDRLGRREEAIRAYQESISINPNRFEPHTSLAILYHRKERFPEAISEYERAFELGEQDLNHLATLCTEYHLVSEFQETVYCFREVLSRDSTNALAQRMLPEALSNLELQVHK
jgi:tetratricopeptide (TPR) repeat protein